MKTKNAWTMDSARQCSVSYREGKATEAERHLLSAETIIAGIMGTNNDYMKTVYRYLCVLYTRWKKPELAQKYKEKLIINKYTKSKLATVE